MADDEDRAQRFAVVSCRGQQPNGKPCRAKITNREEYCSLCKTQLAGNQNFLESVLTYTDMANYYHMLWSSTLKLSTMNNTFKIESYGFTRFEVKYNCSYPREFFRIMCYLE